MKSKKHGTDCGNYHGPPALAADPNVSREARMKQVWQRFISLTGGDPEVAGMGLLVAAFTFVASVAVIVYCLSAGRYVTAAGFALVLGAVVGVCIRDYRRCRWSVLSGLVVIAWVLLAVAGIAYSCWLAFGHG